MRNPKLRPDGDAVLLHLIEDIRYRLAEIDARASAAEQLMREVPWQLPRGTRRELARLSHLVGGVAEAITLTIAETDERLASAVKSRRRAPVRADRA